MASQEDLQEKSAEPVDGHASEDHYVVWEEYDPSHPRNWPIWKKRSHVLLVALITFMTCVTSPPRHESSGMLKCSTYRPFASSMIAPAVPQLKQQLHFDSGILGSFIVSIYLLGYVFGPLVVAPMAEMYGRLPIYHVCNCGFVIMSVACAVSTNVHMLIGFRFLAGTFASSPIA